MIIYATQVYILKHPRFNYQIFAQPFVCDNSEFAIVVCSQKSERRWDQRIESSVQVVR